jgi:hypothetical protein
VSKFMLGDAFAVITVENGPLQVWGFGGTPREARQCAEQHLESDDPSKPPYRTVGMVGECAEWAAKYWKRGGTDDLEKHVELCDDPALVRCLRDDLLDYFAAYIEEVTDEDEAMEAMASLEAFGDALAAFRECSAGSFLDPEARQIEAAYKRLRLWVGYDD